MEKDKVQLTSMGIRHDINFQDGEAKITKEQAINIAMEKEEKYSNEKIKSIEAILGIKKMNTFFYRLDNDIGDNYLVINDISRKVWEISIIHEKIENDITSFDRCYYIDISTGEIIGGETVK